MKYTRFQRFNEIVMECRMFGLIIILISLLTQTAIAENNFNCGKLPNNRICPPDLLDPDNRTASSDPYIILDWSQP